MSPQNNLTKSLSPIMIWGPGANYIISGMYFGCVFELIAGGPTGIIITTLLAIIMCLYFAYCYAELL